jgi:ABC-type sugar transport system permease subunit
VKDKWYDFTVYLSSRFGGKNKKIRTLQSDKIKNLIFYILMIAFPVVQFCVFYIGINFNSILLTFQSYDPIKAKYYFSGLTNLEKVFREFSQYTLTNATKNSALAFVASILVGVPLTLFFSYYIYKKFIFSGLFKVVLFIPSIVSSIAMVLMYKYFVENGVPTMFASMGMKEGLLANADSAFMTVLIYSLWMGFGSGVLLYSGSMGSISESVVEAAQIDGASSAREFFSITLPLIYPTIVTFLITSIAAFFTNQVNLFSFFGENADLQNWTLGYYLYNQTQLASMGEYPYLAALGLCFTLIAVPITIVIRLLLEKFGPSAT